jgi:hypothetical protein
MSSPWEPVGDCKIQVVVACVAVAGWLWLRFEMSLPFSVCLGDMACHALVKTEIHVRVSLSQVLIGILVF